MKLRNLIRNNEADVLWTVGGIFLMGIIFLIVVVAISVIWGFLAFIGVILLCIAGYWIFKTKTMSNLNIKSPPVFIIILAIILILLSQAGFEIYYIDFSFLTGIW